MDLRVKAVALVAGGYNITDTYLGFLGPDGFSDYIENLGVARQHQYQSGEIQYLPAVAGPPDFSPSAMPVEEAYTYYTRAQEHEAPNWENRLICSFDGAHRRLACTRPRPPRRTASACSPRHYGRAPDLPGTRRRSTSGRRSRRRCWIETTNHVELYDGVPHVPQALERIVPWLDENLKSRASEGSAK